MSLENHPNFHAVLFASTIVKGFYESLRGEANKENSPDITKDIIEFVTMIEAKVDAAVEGKPDARNAKAPLCINDPSHGRTRWNRQSETVPGNIFRCDVCNIESVVRDD